MQQQIDLFSTKTDAVSAPEGETIERMRLEVIMERIRANSDRPRLTYQVLTMLASLSRKDGRIGEKVKLKDGVGWEPVRDHIARALLQLTRINPADAKDSSVRTRRLEEGPTKAEENMLASRKTIVSRAMVALEKAGLIRIVYRGHTVDRNNRGGGRYADYMLEPSVRAVVRAPQLH